MPNSAAHAPLERAYQDILKAYALMGYNTQDDDNFRETAQRAAKAA